MSNVITDNFSVNSAAPGAEATPIDVTFTTNTPDTVQIIFVADGNNVTGDEPGKLIHNMTLQLNNMIADLAAIRMSYSE